MDGFSDMAIKLVENVLLLVSLLKETLAYAVPAELAESFELIWKGMIGSSSWMGFLGYSLYGIGLDYGFATEVCEAFGYGYYVIDGMNYIVAFAAPAEDGSGGLGDLAGAATDALAAAGIELPSEVTDAVDAVTDAVAGEGDAAAADGDAAAGDAAASGDDAAASGDAAADDAAAADTEAKE